ncbi:hypothetical protein [Bacillus toyonensis]|uniref:hypothetical protein n=1 Tax=Bacillus toyonensis TaxID=155322 RepID=UPI0020D27031|nr:hypothetical protein [Bacillus toyonensis]
MKNTSKLSFSGNVMKLMLAFIMLFSISASFVLTPNSAFADERIGANKNSSMDGAQGRLRDTVDSSIADKTYIAKTGDTVRGTELVKNGITTDRFTDLTSAEQQKLIDDMASSVSKQQKKDRENGTTNPVTADTANNWLKELQQQKGVGAKLLGNITAQIKPDYVKGNRIFEPFAGPINTAIALVIIVVMVLLTLTFAFDLAYLNIPVFQAFISSSMSEGGGNGASRYSNFFVGREALQAIEESENSSNGKAKNPNGIYLKKRFVGVALLGLCLLYLIQGQIMILVGMLMDLLGGFLE